MITWRPSPHPSTRRYTRSPSPKASIGSPVRTTTLSGMNLAADLVDWTDVDLAQYSLGSSIGMFPHQTFHQAKSVFWTDNPVGDALWKVLHSLAEAGVLDYRQEPDYQFRWSRPGPDILRIGATTS